MTGPAERPGAARRAEAYPRLRRFAEGLPFRLDDFQRTACEAVERGSGVLVCAPTGAGKTVVGEFAVYLALHDGRPGRRRKCFYTTPIKALSNQKYHDLVRRYGPDRVGLLTGDNSINGDAPVVVMTTEVLRNMLYAGSPALLGLAYVVMDEVHYLADPFRGAAWEEVIIHLPASVAVVSLSATVSNAEEFGDWLVTVRGHTEVVVTEERPVPLWQHMLVGRRMFDLFHDREAERAGEVNPQLLRHTRELVRRLGLDRPRGWRHRRQVVPYRPDVITRLDRDGLLPAIVFIFSRAGCDAAVRQCLHSGLQLTTPDERELITEIATARTADIDREDLAALAYWEWLAGLQRGLAAHHAGLLPVFKEVVEELFVRGLIKAVFATETLALGINMPARSVVLERLVKFNGESHVDLTPGEYTQLTGRAGRRGIDVEGHAVVVWNPEIDPRHVAGLASTRTYPLRSSFRPTYNMAVNLVGTLGMERGRSLLDSSFAQFQADRSVVGIARQVRRNQETIARHRDKIACHLGDFEEYFALRTRIVRRERELSRDRAAARRAATRASLERLRVGDVIRVPSGRRAGLAVVLDPDTGGHGEPRPLLLTERRWAGRVPADDFAGPVESLATVKVPRHFNHRSPQARRDLAARLRAADVSGPRRRRRRVADQEPGRDEELDRLRAQLRAHPCHACEQREEHARWAERSARLAHETELLQARAAERTGSLARTFDKVCALLTDLGYLTPDGTVTEAGRTLSRIWTEADLLVSECLRRGVWDGLDAAQLAAAVSVVLYESRRLVDQAAPLPRGPVADAVHATVRLSQELQAEESARGLALTPEPDAGFVWPIYRWTRGESLAKVLDSAVDGDG
ncbi:MAG TPA: DEAD/DEAH box helicase, partial [Natronosporangium sp.]|nr:DEAD/DEAH box helicase [Natronosporangium sp.]